MIAKLFARLFGVGSATRVQYLLAWLWRIPVLMGGAILLVRPEIPPHGVAVLFLALTYPPMATRMRHAGWSPRPLLITDTLLFVTLYLSIALTARPLFDQPDTEVAVMGGLMFVLLGAWAVVLPVLLIGLLALVILIKPGAATPRPDGPVWRGIAGYLLWIAVLAVGLPWLLERLTDLACGAGRCEAVYRALIQAPPA